jgi:hypothetical protein
MVRERRAEDRIGFRVPANITVAGATEPHRGYVIDLSHNGALVMMDRAIPLDGLIELRFHPREGGECRARGKVAHVAEHGLGQAFGIELTWCDDAYQRFVDQLAAASDSEVDDYAQDLRRIHIRVGAIA